MIDHIGIVVSDFEKSKAFDRDALLPVCIHTITRTTTALSYTPLDGRNIEAHRGRMSRA